MTRYNRLLSPGRALCLIVIGLCLSQPVTGRAAAVVINEILASNATIAPLTNYPDYFPDYVELYNSTPNNIPLGPTNSGPSGNWILSTKKNPDPANQADFFRFPAGSMIPADSYLLIFMDDQTNFPGIHTTFLAYQTNSKPTTLTLGRTSGRVKLYDLNLPDTFAFDFSDQLVDSVEFGHQITDLSLGRVPDFTGNFTLTYPNPAGGELTYGTNTPFPFVSAPTSSNQFTLKINEWMATNSAGWDKDWLEVYNPDTNIIALSGLVFVDKLSNLAVPAESRPTPALSFISPLGFVQFFASKNNDPDAPANELGFSISSDSVEPIYIVAGDRATVIDKVTSNNPQRNKTQGRIPDGEDVLTEQVLGQTRNKILPNTSPEESNFASIPEVVINELLAHTDPPLEDAIELANTTGTSQNIGNWWLTNNRDNPKKYRIPSGTIIPAYGFKVFYESQFNSTNPAVAAQPFNLNSANGGECYLYKSDSTGKLLGYRRGVTFGPSANGVSFIRHVVTNEFGTNADIVASSDLSFGTTVRRTDPPTYLSTFRMGTGATNPAPLIGPIVVNEIHYHPPPFIDASDDTISEFIEIYNTSESAVPLYDPQQYFENNQRYADGRTNTWRIRGGVSFDFPEGSSLGAGKFALIVNFDPTGPATNLYLRNFTNKFPALATLVPSEVKIYGPYKGKLSNSGATVEVLRPDAPQGPSHPDFGLVPYITVDLVNYDDTAPWPISPDGTEAGTGDSLQKFSSYDYGNNPLIWFGATPTPGKFNTSSGVESPSISRHPQDLTVTAGRSATFSVTARGGQLHYQWMTNEVEISGATNASITLQNVSANQNALYSVMITNLAGFIISETATLTVVPPLSDSLRPTLTIATPTFASTTNEAIIVGGKAADKNGISAVFYSVNGGPFIAATGSLTMTIWGTPLPVILSAGTNIISAYSVDQASNTSLTNSRSYFYSSRTPLTLLANGNGAVKGATNNQPLELGRNFLLTATPSAGNVFSNWLVTTNLTLAFESSSPTLSFSLVSNTVVTANFVPNPFTIVAGKYNGLFYDETNGVSHGSSGNFLLTATASGSYSASLLTGGLKLSASGQLDLNGRATNNILRKGTNALTVTWAVALDGSDTVTGTVSDGTWVAALNGERAVFTKTNPCTLAGKYTFVLPGLPGDSFVPGGASYGTVSIDSNGVATLKGFLSDKTSAAQKGQLSKNGEWPLYIPLYSNKGSLLSWIGFTNRLNDDFNGLLNWGKPALATAKYHPLGFTTNESTVVGSRYAAPVGTNKILHITSGELFLSGGNLAQDYTNTFNLGLSSKLTNIGPSTLTVTFTTSSGLFKGSLTPTNAGAKAIAFTGAVMQKGTNAFGYFLGTNQSGTVSIHAAP